MTVANYFLNCVDWIREFQEFRKTKSRFDNTVQSVCAIRSRNRRHRRGEREHTALHAFAPSPSTNQLKNRHESRGECTRVRMHMQTISRTCFPYKNISRFRGTRRHLRIENLTTFQEMPYKCSSSRIRHFPQAFENNWCWQSYLSVFFRWIFQTSSNDLFQLNLSFDTIRIYICNLAFHVFHSLDFNEKFFLFDI